MAHSFPALTRAFSDQLEASTGDRRSASTTSPTTHPSKEHRGVDVVVHLTGSRVLRPVLVHPDKSRRSVSVILPPHSDSPPPPSSRRGASPGGSRSADHELAGGGGGSDLVRLRSPVNTDSSTTSVRCWSANASFDAAVAGGPPQVADDDPDVRDRPTLDALRADSEPRTRAELDRHSPLGSCAMPSVVFSVDELTHDDDDRRAAVVAPADRERPTPPPPPAHDDSAQKRLKYRRASKAQRHVHRSSATSEMLPLNASSRDSGDRLASTSTCVSRSAARRRRRARLRINVSGQYFEIARRTLAQHPKTLLGDLARRTRYYDAERDEFFFDRHRPSFEAIFAYYQTGGRLRRPFNVPDDIFLDELLFYELEPDAVDEYKRSEGYAFEEPPMPSNRLQRRVWMLFEHPDTSRAAFFIAILSVAMTLVSIVLFCVETLPVFATSHCVVDEEPNFLYRLFGGSGHDSPADSTVSPNFLDPFFIIETACTAWFTIEAIVRFAACPSKVAFWKDFKNIVDVVAVFPYYVTLFNVLSSMSCEGAKSSASLSFLRVIRLVRVFKLTKHSVGLQVLVLTFKASLEGLGLFLVALFVSLLVFSSAIYYAELGQPNSQMNSIPDAFWWAIITMTTVGYGDKVPVGPTGRLIGAACAITGVLTLAIPVPIITGHFNRFYSHRTGRGRHT